MCDLRLGKEKRREESTESERERGVCVWREKVSHSHEASKVKNQIKLNTPL